MAGSPDTRTGSHRATCPTRSSPRTPATSRRESPGGTNSGTPHGTAVSEIVHDVAPGALLWLIKVCTDVDLAQAVDYAKAEDVDIITTSLGWYNVTPGDGTGFFDAQVDEARAAGILWTTAAANSREELLGRHVLQFQQRQLPPVPGHQRPELLRIGSRQLLGLQPRFHVQHLHELEQLGRGPDQGLPAPPVPAEPDAESRRADAGREQYQQPEPGQLPDANRRR